NTPSMIRWRIMLGSLLRGDALVNPEPVGVERRAVRLGDERLRLGRRIPQQDMVVERQGIAPELAPALLPVLLALAVHAPGTQRGAHPLVGTHARREAFEDEMVEAWMRRGLLVHHRERARMGEEKRRARLFFGNVKAPCVEQATRVF